MVDKGKVLYRKNAFYGGSKITNKVVADIVGRDERGVLNSAIKRKEVYEKFKDFGHRGRGLTEVEAKMALAELKQDTHNHLSRKGIDTLASELGLGKGKITQKMFRNAKKYKQRVSYKSSNKIKRDIQVKVDQNISSRRDGYASKIAREVAQRSVGNIDTSPEGRVRTKIDSHNARSSSSRQLGLNTSTRNGYSSRMISSRLSSGTIRPSCFSSTRSPISRLSSGMRGRFGSSHTSISRLR